MATCEVKLEEAKTALHALSTGELVTSISVNGRTTQYTQANINDLRRYVRELEAECGTTDSYGDKKGRRGTIMFRG